MLARDCAARKPASKSILDAKRDCAVLVAWRPARSSSWFPTARSKSSALITKLRVWGRAISSARLRWSVATPLREADLITDWTRGGVLTKFWYRSR